MELHRLISTMRRSSAPGQHVRTGRSATPRDGASCITSGAAHSSEGVVSVANLIAKSKEAGGVQGPNNQAKAAYSPNPSAVPQPFSHKGDRRDAFQSRRLASILIPASAFCASV